MARVPRKPSARVAQAKRIPAQKAWIGRHNYVLNSETVLRDVYRLLNVVMADDALARLAVADGDVLVRMRDQFVEDELVHLLIGTAVMNRSHDDHMAGPRKDADELSFKPVPITCGQLTEDLGGPKEQEIALTLREGCNKIIHAEQITVEPHQIEGAAFPSLPMTVVLRGTQGKKAWQATLNVPDYVRATYMNFQDV